MKDFGVLRRTNPFTAFRSPTSINHRIFRATVVVGLLSIAVKLVGTLKELTVAAIFGRGDAVDAFLIAYLMPAFAVALVAGSLNLALMPTYLQVREQEGPEQAEKLLSSVNVISLFFMVAITGLLAVLGPLLLPLVAPSFGPDKLRLTRHLFYVLLPVIALTGVSTNCATVLNASGRFGLPALTPMVTPLLSLLLLVTRARVWGIWVVAVGFTLGAACEAAILVKALARCGRRIRLRWFGMSPALRQVCLQYAPLWACCIGSTAVTIVDQAMASWLQPGSVAALSYGGRIVNVVVGLSAVSVGTAIVPYFSQMVARKDFEGCRHTLRTYSWLLLGLGLPVCLLMVIGSEQLVRVLYQRGAFTPNDTLVVARVQAMYALQIPFHVASLLHVRLLTALRRNDLVMASSGLNLTLDIILNLVCMRFFGIAGIALATSLFYVGCFVFLTMATRHVMRQALDLYPHAVAA